MIAEEDTKPPPYIKPAMLRYKREWKGMSVEEAAKRMRIKPERIDLWEAGKASPTIWQAMRLAKVYACYFDELTLDEPLPMPKLTVVPDFRKGPGARADIKKPAVRDLLIWAEGRHEDALSLYEDLDESPATVPAKLRATLGDDPEASARKVRQGMDYPLEAQVSANNRDFPASLRSALESLGILTFLATTRLGIAQARGLCLSFKKLPVIMLKSEAPAAQAFMLAHAFGHIVLGQSGIIAPYAGVDGGSSERWCDRFAASFLIPQKALAQHLGDPPRSARSEFADKALRRLAQQFSVCEHAMLIRLVHLQYVKASYYWGAKRQQFLSRAEECRGFSRANYYSSRHVSDMGLLYSTLVVRAWAEELITVDKAAHFMEISNYNHVEDIRRGILNS